MRLYLLLVLLAGCGQSDIAALSITPDASFMSGLQQAATLTYADHSIVVNGTVGDFKLVLKNTSSEPLTSVELHVTANDPTLFFDFFGRIYRTLFWGGDLFANPYAVFDADDLDGGASVEFDSIILGEPGLALEFSAYASLSDGTHVALPLDSTTVKWSY